MYIISVDLGLLIQSHYPRVFWWDCHSDLPSLVLFLGAHTRDQSSRPVWSHVCVFAKYGMCTMSIACFTLLSFPIAHSRSPAFHPDTTPNPTIFGLQSWIVGWRSRRLRWCAVRCWTRWPTFTAWRSSTETWRPVTSSSCWTGTLN